MSLSGVLARSSCVSTMVTVRLMARVCIEDAPCMPRYLGVRGLDGGAGGGWEVVGTGTIWLTQCPRLGLGEEMEMEAITRRVARSLTCNINSLFEHVC